MRPFLFVIIMYGAVSLWAQVHSFLAVEMQNDFLDCRGHGTDRYYTAGNRIQYLSAFAKNRVHYSIAIMQQAYTPSDLQDSARRYQDYPYAGILFAENSIRYTGSDSSWFSVLTFSLGNTGKKSGVEAVQRGLHRLLDDEMPRGWHHILELGTYCQVDWSFYRKIEAGPNGQLLLLQEWDWGTIYKRVKMGMQFRLGQIPASRLNFISTENGTHSAAQVKQLKAKRFSIYLAPCITWLISNKILERGLSEPGNYAWEISGKNILRRTMLELEAGVGYQFPRLALLYHQSWQQPEFSGGESHHYGAVSIIWELH